MSLMRDLEKALNHAKSQDFGVLDVSKDCRVNRRVIYLDELKKVEVVFGKLKQQQKDAVTRLKDDLVMFFRDYNLPSILNKNLNELVDEWTKKELLGKEENKNENIRKHS